MGVNSSRVSAITDTAVAVTLRNAADGAESATATETAVSLNQLKKAYWHDNEIPHGVFQINLNIVAIDNTTGDETYVFDLIVDDVAAMNDSPRVVASATLATKVAGFYTLFVDSRNIPNFDTDNSGAGKWLAIRATLGGTTPSVTYGAWISRTRLA